MKPLSTKFLKFLIVSAFLIIAFLAFNSSAINTFAQDNNEQKKATITKIYTGKCSLDSTNDCNKASIIVDSPGKGPQNAIEAEVNLNTYENYEVYGKYSVGDLINVKKTGADGYTLVNPSRDSNFLLLFIVFFIFAIAVGKAKGFRSIIALTSSTLVILLGLIPLFVKYPSYILPIGFIGVLVVYIINQLIGHGFSKLSYLSILSASMTFILALAFSYVVSGVFKITGFGDDNAVFVAQEVTQRLNLSINLGDVFIIGLLFGLAGAVDDVNVTQIHSVKEFCELKEDIGFAELYQKSMKIGTSHMVSIINTLFLAYVGAALPTIMLFGILDQHPLELISREDLTEEILRTLIASAGLILAIPLSTLLAISTYIKKPTKLMDFVNSILRTR